MREGKSYSGFNFRYTLLSIRSHTAAYFTMHLDFLFVCHRLEKFCFLHFKFAVLVPMCVYARLFLRVDGVYYVVDHILTTIRNRNVYYAFILMQTDSFAAYTIESVEYTAV